MRRIIATVVGTAALFGALALPANAAPTPQPSSGTTKAVEATSPSDTRMQNSRLRVRAGLVGRIAVSADF